MSHKDQNIDLLLQSVLAGDIRQLSKAITLIESELYSDSFFSENLLEKVLPYSGRSFRIGISGAPGVGKSTFINQLGKRILAAGKKLAILSVDPSSSVSGGSIMVDKARMKDLQGNDAIYIRPSANKALTGGVTVATFASMLLCESAGFEIVMIETVGVGQSDEDIRGMVDYLIYLTSPGGGDEWQAMKRGGLEQIDALLINKSDTVDEQVLQLIKVWYLDSFSGYGEKSASKLYLKEISAEKGCGVDEVWSKLESEWQTLDIPRLRTVHLESWIEYRFWEKLEVNIKNDSSFKEHKKREIEKFRQGQLLPTHAIQSMLDFWLNTRKVDSSK